MWEANQHNSPNYSARANLYQANSLPHAEFQGEYPVVGGGINMYPSYLGRYNLYIDQDSPAEIEMSIRVNDAGEKVLEADVTMTGDITTTNNKIIFILTHYWNDNYFSTVSFYEEQEFDLSITGESGHFENVVSYDQSWDISTVKAVVLIQSLSSESKRIHQAAINDIELIMDPLEPDFIDFGEVPVGNSVTEQITISNYWGDTMRGTIFPLPTFNIVGSFSIAPYQTETLDITFTPTEETVYNNFIILMSDNPIFDTQLLPVMGTGTVNNDSDDNEISPTINQVIGNYPNPFNPSTTIEYSIGENNVNESLIIFNAKGQTIKEFTNLVPGENSVNWDGKNSQSQSVPSGIYFYILGSQKMNNPKKMVLIK